MTTLPFTLALSLAQLQSADLEALRRTVSVEAAAVERSPDNTDALYRLGLAYLALGQPKKAIGPLEQLVQADADSIDGKLLLSRAYRGAGEMERAVKMLDQALVSHPDEMSLHAERALLARSLDDTESAITHYRKATELSPSDAALMFNLGEALHKSRKNLDDAIACYRQALAMDPELTAAKVNLGKALAEKGLFGEAKEILSSVSKQTLADAEAHYNLGVIFMREGNVTGAVTEFERALAISPKYAQVLNNLGVAYDAVANSKKALEYFRKAVAADSTYAEAHFNIGMSYMKMDQPGRATQAFERALKLEPESSGPFVQLGTLYLKQGKKDRAVEAFTRAIAAAEVEDKGNEGFLQLIKWSDRKRSTDAYRGLAMAYLAQGKVDEAVNTLKQAVEKMPKDPSARAALGDAYLAQGSYDGAIEQLIERLSLEPSTEAQLDLARAYMKRRVAKLAEPLFQAVLASDPENRDARMGMVDLFLAMGRYGEAEAALKAALEKDGGDLQALSRLGILKSRMGRPDEALAPLEKVSAQSPLMYDARAEYAFLLFRGDPSNAKRCVGTMSDILTSEPRHVLSLQYLGVCLYALGKKDQAESSFKGALKVDPLYSAAHFSLGELYENEGKVPEAKEAYEAASKLDHTEARDALKRLSASLPPTP